MYGEIFVDGLASFQAKSLSIFGYANILKSETWMVSGNKETQYVPVCDQAIVLIDVEKSLSIIQVSYTQSYWVLLISLKYSSWSIHQSFHSNFKYSIVQRHHIPVGAEPSQ